MKPTIRDLLAPPKSKKQNTQTSPDIKTNPINDEPMSLKTPTHSPTSTPLPTTPPTTSATATSSPPSTPKSTKNTYARVAQRPNNPYTTRTKIVEFAVNPNTAPPDNHSTRYTTRATIKIRLQASPNPIEHLLEELTDFLEHLTSADDQAVLKPWKLQDRASLEIVSLDEIDKKRSVDLRKYFHQVRPGNSKAASDLYVGVYIGHDEEYDILLENMAFWTATGNGIYKKMLQVEETIEIGWLLYSTMQMDKESLAYEFWNHFGIEVGLRWKVIGDGLRGKTDESTKVRALHVEVSKANCMANKYLLIKKLGKDYTGASSSFPNGIRLRFCKLLIGAINHVEKQKIAKVRGKQKLFLDNILTTTSAEISHLESTSGSLELTLREMIMKIPSNQYANTSLFHSVDLDYRRQGHVFQYFKPLQDEAESMIQAVLPYLEHYHGKEVQKYFTQITIDRTRAYVYDETLKMVRDTSSERNVEIMINEELVSGIPNDEIQSKSDNDSDSQTTINNTSSTKKSKPNKKPTRRPDLTTLKESYIPNDTDSVSTFGGGGRSLASATSGGGGRSVPSSFDRRASSRKDDLTVVSGISQVSMDDLAALESRMEDKLQTQTVIMQSMKTMLSQLGNISDTRNQPLSQDDLIHSKSSAQRSQSTEVTSTSVDISSHHGQATTSQSKGHTPSALNTDNLLAGESYDEEDMYA
jgi:hypothetical protein